LVCQLALLQANARRSDVSSTVYAAVSAAYRSTPESKTLVLGPRPRWFQFWFDLEPRAFYSKRPDLQLYQAVVRLTWFSHKYLGIRVIDRPYGYDEMKQHVIEVASRILRILRLRPLRRSHYAYQMSKLIADDLKVTRSHPSEVAPPKEAEPAKPTKAEEDSAAVNALYAHLRAQQAEIVARAKREHERDERFLSELLTIREQEQQFAVRAIEKDRELWESTRRADPERYPVGFNDRYRPSYEAGSPHNLNVRYAILYNHLIARPAFKHRVPLTRLA